MISHLFIFKHDVTRHQLIQKNYLHVCNATTPLKCYHSSSFKVMPHRSIWNDVTSTFRMIFKIDASKWDHSIFVNDNYFPKLISCFFENWNQIINWYHFWKASHNSFSMSGHPLKNETHIRMVKRQTTPRSVPFSLFFIHYYWETFLSTCIWEQR